MLEIRTRNIPKKCVCEVKYYVLGTPLTDPHFAPEPSFVVENHYFETRKEAEALKEELEQKDAWVEYEVCEKIKECYELKEN